MKFIEKKLTNTVLFFSVVLLFASHFVLAQGVLLERSYTITSEKESLIEAKKEIQEKAIQNAVEDITREMIGEERLTKNKISFQNKVVSKAAKFIPFTKTTEPVVKDAKTTQTVLLKVSLQDLKNILKQNRLLEEIDQKLNVLPLVQFENSILSKKYRWWSKQDEGLKKLSLVFENHFQKNLLKSGMFLQRPTFFEYQNSMPPVLLQERWNVEDLVYLARWYQSPFILEGSFVVKNSEKKSNQIVLVVKLNLIQAQTGRVLLDLQRQYDSPSFKETNKLEAWVESKISEEADSIALDFSQQLDEILQKGILNSQKIRLQFVMGPMPSRIETIKDKLKVYSSIIKSIREREITSQFVVYEVDFTGSVQDLQNKIISTDFGFATTSKLSLVRANEKEMVFDIK